MKSFKELGVKSETDNLVGDKIKITRIIDKLIEVHKYKIGPSKYEGFCLSLQIKFNDEMRVIFSRSKYLMDMIRKVPEDGLPFETKIIKDDYERLFFT